MKKQLITIFLLASFLGVGQAIKFGALGGGLENNGYYTPVRSMFYDTIDKKLYVSGQFKTAENKIVWGAAVWNGTAWDSLRGGLTQYPHQIAPSATPSDFAWKIIRYKNKIYFGGGGIEWVNGKNQYNLGIWNGTDWDYPLPEPSPANTSINDMIVYNDTLYACGMFTNFGTVTCNYVAKYDGTSWHPVGDLSKYYKNVSAPAAMQAIAMYNNEIYVGGEFDDSTGTPRNIAKYNGSQWVNVGTGIRQGGVNCVFALQEFNNKLYIGGRFARSQEIPGESLVMWNGSAYQEINSYGIGGGQISSFKKHKDKLFVTGNYNTYGPLTAYNVFYLDTNNNACVINSLNDSYNKPTMYNIERVDFINDSLVVAGLFSKLDTVSANDVGVITNYETDAGCFYVGIKENTFGDGLIKIYPNPVSEKLTLELSTAEIQNLKLTITNTLGQIIYSLANVSPLQEINVSSFTSGIYFLKVQNNSGQRVFKVLKD